MATVYVDGVAGEDTSTGSVSMPVQTFARAEELVADGDTILVDQAVYHEMVLPAHSGVTYKAAPDARPIIDGDFVRNSGFNSYSDSVAANRIEGFEIRNQTYAGIYVGSSRGAVAGHVITGNLIHHVVGPDLWQYGIRCAGGDPEVYDNEVHSIGSGNEAMGIWLGQCKDYRVYDNLIYLVRKGGIRDWESLLGEITSNRIFACWAGIELNASVSPLVANNDCSYNQAGIYPKHTNFERVMDDWGLPSAPAWARVWHNTMVANRWASLVMATNGEPLDYLDVQNNIFAGFGDTFIHDAPEVRTENIIVNHNSYLAPESPPYFWRTGFSNPIQPEEHKTITEVRTDFGWEADAGPADLPSAWGTQMGADLPASRVDWVAQRATSLDSSFWGGGPEGPAGLFDDRMWTQVNPAPTGNEWAIADLGEVKTISHFWQDPTTHGATYNVREYRWDVSLDGIAWVTAAEGEVADVGAATVWTDIPGGPVQARFIRYTMLSNFGNVTFIGSGGVGAAQLVLEEVVEPPPAPPAPSTALPRLVKLNGDLVLLP